MASNGPSTITGRAPAASAVRASQSPNSNLLLSYKQVRGVFRYLGAPAMRVVTRAADEAGHRAGAGEDGEDGAVAEDVDEAPPLGLAGESRPLDELIGVAQRTQVTGERIPAGRGIPRVPARLGGWAEPACLQVLGHPAAGHPITVEAGGQKVQPSDDYPFLVRR